MRYSTCVVVTALVTLWVVNVAAPSDVKIEEQVVGPVGSSVSYAVSPHGVHLASVTMQGSRSVVVVDGVAGPKFDQLLLRN